MPRTQVPGTPGLARRQDRSGQLKCHAQLGPYFDRLTVQARRLIAPLGQCVRCRGDKPHIDNRIHRIKAAQCAVGADNSFQEHRSFDAFTLSVSGVKRWNVVHESRLLEVATYADPPPRRLRQCRVAGPFRPGDYDRLDNEVDLQLDVDALISSQVHTLAVRQKSDRSEYLDLIRRRRFEAFDAKRSIRACSRGFGRVSIRMGDGHRSPRYAGSARVLHRTGERYAILLTQGDRGTGDQQCNWGQAEQSATSPPDLKGCRIAPDMGYDPC